MFYNDSMTCGDCIHCVSVTAVDCKCDIDYSETWSDCPVENCKDFEACVDFYE